MDKKTSFFFVLINILVGRVKVFYKFVAKFYGTLRCM